MYWLSVLTVETVSLKSKDDDKHFGAVVGRQGIHMFDFEIR